MLPLIATPAFATGAGTIACPLTFTIHSGTTGTIPCTMTYTGADGSTITLGTGCATILPFACTGWTMSGPTPASFVSNSSPGPHTQSISFQITSPAACSDSIGPHPCHISVQITASGGGLAEINGGTIVAVATILVSTPEFGVAAVAVAAGLVGLLTLRRRAVISPAAPV
jgi:hypothetical protein